MFMNLAVELLEKLLCIKFIVCDG